MWGLWNTALSLTVNLGLNILLIPRLGIEGAAISWAVARVLDNVVPLVQIRIAFGLHPFGRVWLTSAMGCLVCFGLPGVLVRATMGTTVPAFVVYFADRGHVLRRMALRLALSAPADARHRCRAEASRVPAAHPRAPRCQRRCGAREVVMLSPATVAASPTRRVGIMSMQRILNYGSSLQAYGLSRLLSDLDESVDVSFVDYVPGAVLVEDPQGTSRATRLVRKVVEHARGDASIADKMRFFNHKRRYAGRNFPLLGIPRDRNHDLNLDVEIIGSDEVFNCIQASSNVGYSPDLFGGARRRAAWFVRGIVRQHDTEPDRGRWHR